MKDSFRSLSVPKESFMAFGPGIARRSPLGSTATCSTIPWSTNSGR
jgi:hypothetical protein